MKRFMLLMTAAMIGSGAYSEVLSPEAALNRVVSSTSARHIKGMSSITPTLVKTVMADNEPAVYVFNRGTNGALIVSADDEVGAVLGILDDGEIDVANMPPAMTQMLENYANEIAYLRENPQVSSAKASAKAKTEREAISPMCTTLWAQGSPYNYECPAVSSNGTYASAATGCVATCLAQVLKYFNYPTQGEGEYSYAWNNETLSYDFDNNPFDWEHMLDRYDKGKPTDEEIDAVAQLMFACGVVCDMNYKSGGSGAYPVNLLKTGAKYLKLDKGLRYHNRDYYSLSEWNDMVYDALKNSGPVMYNGCILGYTTYAHEFVCDGYLSDELFHINWGWGENDGTSYNGYYRLSALDPYRAGIKQTSRAYNYYQDIVCYIQPPVEGSTVYEQMYCGDNFVIATTTQSLGGSISLSGGLYNYSAETLSGVAGIKICKEDGTLVCYSGNTKFSDLPLSVNFGTYSVALPSTLEDGTYVVTPAFKVDGSEWKDVQTKVSGVRSYNMTVSSGNCSFVSNKVPTLTVTDFSLDSPIYLNKWFTVTAKITNNGNEPYSGKVALGLISKNSTGTRRQVSSTSYYVPLYVDAGETLDFEYSDYFTDGTVDVTYEVALVDGSKNYLSDLIETTLLAQSAYSGYSVTSDYIEVDNADNVDKMAINGRLQITCTKGLYTDYVKLWAYELKDDGTANATIIDGFSTDVFTLNEGESTVRSFHGQMPDGVTGKKYVLFAIDSQGSGEWFADTSGRAVRQIITIGEGNSTGAEDIATESQVISTQYFNLQGVSLGDKVSAPGLYLKVEKLANGTQKTTKCKIR